jgi:hypothetical protein
VIFGFVLLCSLFLKVPAFQQTLDFEEAVTGMPESRLHDEVSHFVCLVSVRFEAYQDWVIVINCRAWCQQYTVTVSLLLIPLVKFIRKILFSVVGRI